MPNQIQNLVLPSFDFNLNQFDNLYSNAFSSISNFELSYSFDTYEHSGLKTNRFFSNLCSGLDLGSYLNPIQPTSAHEHSGLKTNGFFSNLCSGLDLSSYLN